jgi:hypothetical protein
LQPVARPRLENAGKSTIQKLEQQDDSDQPQKRQKQDTEITSTVAVDDYCDTITILVGESEEKFLVHTQHLRKIDWFRKCLDAGMEGSQSKTIRLPEESPEAFRIVVQWIYRADLGKNNLERLVQTECHSLIIRIYGLACKYLMTEIQNAIVDFYDARDLRDDYSFWSSIFAMEELGDDKPYKPSLITLGYLLREAHSKAYPDNICQELTRGLDSEVEAMKIMVQALTTRGPRWAESLSLARSRKATQAADAAKPRAPDL